MQSNGVLFVRPVLLLFRDDVSLFRDDVSFFLDDRLLQREDLSVKPDDVSYFFLDDGNIEATNNRRERELRRLALGSQELALHLAR